MKAILKADPTRVGNIDRVYITDFGQKRLVVVLDDEETGTLSIIDAEAGAFEVFEEENVGLHISK
jgi:hypothetical protein